MESRSTRTITFRGRCREGEVRYEYGTTPTEYTYTGQFSYGADFGLMFFNARWYDPGLGRFPLRFTSGMISLPTLYFRGAGKRIRSSRARGIPRHGIGMVIR
jgi:hypothetical protein